MEKPKDAKLYWETFLTPEGKPYFFCAATDTTVWERPAPPALVLKHHWGCFEADGPDVYFAHDETNETSWDLAVAIDAASAPAPAAPAPAVAAPAAPAAAPAAAASAPAATAAAPVSKVKELALAAEAKKRAEAEEAAAKKAGVGGVGKPAGSAAAPGAAAAGAAAGGGQSKVKELAAAAEAKRKAEADAEARAVEEARKAEEERRAEKAKQKAAEGDGSHAVRLFKVDDPAVYWQTHIDADKSPYYFNEITNETTRVLPSKKTVPKPGSIPPSVLAAMGPAAAAEGVYPLIMPPGYIAVDDGSGRVYFADENDVTSYDMPPGIKTAAPAPGSEPAAAPAAAAKQPIVIPGHSHAGQQAVAAAAAAAAAAPATPTGASAAASSASSAVMSSAAEAANTELQAIRGAPKPVEPRARAEHNVLIAVKQYRLRKAEGRCGIKHRPWLFKNSVSDSYLLVHPSPVLATLSKIKSDPAFTFVTIISAPAALKQLGFDDDPINAGNGGFASVSSQWNATPDPTSGKHYYFNVATKETVWAVPAGGVIVARVVPNNTVMLQRVLKELATGGSSSSSAAGAGGLMKTLQAAVTEAQIAVAQSNQQMSGEAAAMAAQVAADAAASSAAAQKSLQAEIARQQALAALPSQPPVPQLMDGWLFKSDPRGKNFQKRWLVANARTGELSWYHSAPAMTLAKFETAESAKGSMPLASAKVEVKASEPPPKGLPTPFAIVVSGTARSITLCATSPELASAWATYLSGVADASVQKQLADYAAAQAALAAPAAAAGAGDAAAASSAAYVDPVQPLAGWLEVSSPDAKYSPTPFMKLYARLDPSSRLLLFFNSAGMEPGTEKAVVDLLSAVLYNEYPQLASPSAVPVPVPPQPSAPAFWLQVEDEGIFGPGPGRAPATTLVAESAEACATWIAAIAAACDPSTMKQASEEEKAAAPVLSTALLHSQRGAGIFNALGSTLERKVIVHPASKTLTLYTDARGVKPAVVLRLAAEHGVRFDFRCDEKGPANKAFGCLKMEISAPVLGNEAVIQTHIFKTRNHADYCAWAAALAAL